MSENKNEGLKLNEDLETFKNQKEKIASDLLDAENLIKKLKKENCLLKNSGVFNFELNNDERIIYNEFNNQAENEKVENNERAIGNNDNYEAEIKMQMQVNEIEAGKKELNNEFHSENKEEKGIFEVNNKLRKLANLFIHTPKVIFLFKKFKF